MKCRHNHIHILIRHSSNLLFSKVPTGGNPNPNFLNPQGLQDSGYGDVIKIGPAQVRSVAHEAAAAMPLYDFVVMVKPAVDRRGLVELMKRLGERVYARNGVVTNVKSFGRVNLAYGIRKRDGRFFEGQMMQMSVMVPPAFPKELEFLNKEERLLRWMMIKSRGNQWSKVGKET